VKGESRFYNRDVASSSRPILLAALFGVTLTIAGCGASTAPSTSSTTAPPSTSSPTTSTTPSAVQPDTAVWPFAVEGTRSSDPVSAARSFAVTFLGFVDPVLGAFQQGDSRSGEVAVQANSTGPVTTVIVRMLTPDNTWWVLGASTPNLQIQTPKTLESISSPVMLSGQTTAFEATVNVQIRQDGVLAPLKKDIVMGGSNGVMGPFSKMVSFTKPTAKAGAIVLETLSAKDGSISEASVIRVPFSS
jgi:hypothetical protein